MASPTTADNPSSAEAIPRFQEQILDAIDQLRRRKARPDAERIYNSLSRRHSTSFNDARNALDRCVLNGSVLRVEYKGNISYRNAAKKFSHLKLGLETKAAAKNKPSRKFNSILTMAFADLILQESDYLEFGVPASELIRNILSKDHVKYTRKYVMLLLDKEVEAGGVTRMTNGNFFLVGTKKPPVITTVGLHNGGSAVTHYTPKAFRRTTTTATNVVAAATLAKFKDVAVVHNNSQQLTAVTGTGSYNKNIVVVEELNSAQMPDPPSSDNNSGKDSPPSTGLKYKKKQPILKRKLKDHLKHIDVDSNLRIGGRRKRAKKVFDPSDNNLPKKRGRPAGSLNRTTVEKQQLHLTVGANSTASSGRHSSNHSDDNTDSRPNSRASSAASRDLVGVCSVCHLSNRKGGEGRLVSCRECSNKAHVSCLNGDDMMLRMSPDNTWSCPHCKTCVVCDQTKGAGSFTVCSVCADAYHLTCHKPVLPDKVRSNNKWLCKNCEMPTSQVLAVKDIEQLGFHVDAAKTLNGEISRDSIVSDTSNSQQSQSPDSPGAPHLSPQTTTPNHNKTSKINSSSTTSNQSDIDDEEEEHDDDVENSEEEDENNEELAMVGGGGGDSGGGESEEEDKVGKKGEFRVKQERERDGESVDVKEEEVVGGELKKEDSEEEDEEDEERRDSKRSSVIGEEEDDEFDFEENIDPSIPDASQWSHNEVYEYFVRYFPEEEAKVFKEQEIDGCSLLLLRRMDVLKSLKLRLGPALKIYRHVLKLQYRRDDPKLFWT